MKRKFSVYMIVDAGITVDVEVDIKDGMTKEAIEELVYETACEEVDISEASINDIGEGYEIVDEETDEVIASNL